MFLKNLHFPKKHIFSTNTNLTFMGKKCWKLQTKIWKLMTKIKTYPKTSSLWLPDWGEVLQGGLTLDLRTKHTVSSERCPPSDKNDKSPVNLSGSAATHMLTNKHPIDSTAYPSQRELLYSIVQFSSYH